MYIILLLSLKMIYLWSEYEKETAKKNGLQIEDLDEYYLMSEYANSSEVLEKIVNYLIDKIGFDRYSELVKEYNKELIENYKTNSEIINSNNNPKTR